MRARRTRTARTGRRCLPGAAPRSAAPFLVLPGLPRPRAPRQRCVSPPRAGAAPRARRGPARLLPRRRRCAAGAAAHHGAHQRRCRNHGEPARPGTRAQRSHGHTHLRLLRHGEPLSISEALPILESFGLRVIAERPYELRAIEGRTAWVQDFELEAVPLLATDPAALEAQLNIAYTAILAGELDSDGFHRLIVSAGLTVAQTRVLRACCRYLLQTGIPFSQAYIARSLHEHAHIARDLWRLFERRLGPYGNQRRAPRQAAAIERRRAARRHCRRQAPGPRCTLRCSAARPACSTRTSFL